MWLERGVLQEGIMLAPSWLVRSAPLALVFALACRARVDVDDGNGGDGSGGDGQGGGNVDPQCVPFRDAEPQSAVTIRVRNESGLDVYLPAGCGQLEYAITPVGGDDGVYYGPTGGFCSQSCEELQSQPPLSCLADAGAPTSIRVASGEVLDVAWDGRGSLGADMPLACWYSKDVGTTCTQIVNATPGEYDVGARGFSSCGAGCECGADGVCNGDAQDLEAYANPAIISLPSEGVVEILFDFCAFGCAGEGNPG